MQVCTVVSGKATSAKGSSLWATPTFKSAGNRACVRLSPAGLKFQADLNQVGKQMGLRNQALAWTLLTDLMQAMGWSWTAPVSSHQGRVILLNGEKHSTDSQSLNPAFTDWMMGWPMHWTDPARSVTEWSHWLQRARGML